MYDKIIVWEWLVVSDIGFLFSHDAKNIYCKKMKIYYFCRCSGSSSARLEYTSGGRVVAGSNPVSPTIKSGICAAFLFQFIFRSKIYGKAINVS